MPDLTSALELARAAAARLGTADWQLDAEPPEEPDGAPIEPPAVQAADPPSVLRPPPSEEPPPPLERIVEAMLFVGGSPLTAAKAASAIRGLTAEAFRNAVDGLAKEYRRQRRPYTVRSKGGGFVLALRPEYRAVKDGLAGSPREVRLGQPTLDAMSLIAYRQPIAKAELDALRGSDTGPLLRQLVRLGLVAAGRRGGSPDAGYRTTPRFLELFGLTSLDDLPRLAEG